MTINPNTRSAAKLPDWLSPREFALWAGVNEETVRRWLRAGTVQGRKIGPRLWEDSPVRGGESGGGERDVKATEYMEQLRNAKSYASRTRIMLRASRDNELSFAGYLAIKNLYDRLNEGEKPAHV